MHKLFVETEANRPFFGQTVEQINDHAGRLDVALQAVQGLRVMVDQNGRDIQINADLAITNDRQLKEGLKRLETEVGTQGAASPTRAKSR